MSDTVLLTGGNGFIGAWIAKRLLARGVPLRIFARREDRTPLRAIAGALADTAEWFVGDVADPADVDAAAEGCGAIIHTAAMLAPACTADPRLAMAVNLGGTLNVFETARRLGIKRLIYTSTGAVYGPSGNGCPAPNTQYGVLKLAEEGCARAYAIDHGLPSIGFRPFIVYGPGREKGFSAGPSLACRAAARGQPFVIPFDGRTGFVFVDDIASAYEEALFAAPSGAELFNLAGEIADVSEFVDGIRAVLPDADVRIAGPTLSRPPAIDPYESRALLPNIRRTALADGIRTTIEYYRSVVQSA